MSGWHDAHYDTLRTAEINTDLQLNQTRMEHESEAADHWALLAWNSENRYKLEPCGGKSH